MGQRDFAEFIKDAVNDSKFFVAVILKAVAFALSVVSGILAIPFSGNILGGIIGTVVGGLFNLFLIVLPLFEILKAKSSQNFKNDCDFGLKYIRTSTIITLVILAILTVIVFILTLTADFRFGIVLLLCGILLAYIIIQLEIINDLRNGLFYNIEKVSFTLPYLLLTVVGALLMIALTIVYRQYFESVTQFVGSLSDIIFACLILKANKNYKKHLL